METAAVANCLDVSMHRPAISDGECFISIARAIVTVEKKRSVRKGVRLVLPVGLDKVRAGKTKAKTGTLQIRKKRAAKTVFTFLSFGQALQMVRIANARIQIRPFDRLILQFTKVVHLRELEQAARLSQ